MRPYLILAGFLFIYLVFWYLISIIKKRNDVADIAWGLGFPLLAWAAYLISGFSWTALISNILISLWGLRLASHIYKRFRQHSEDPRYLAWRQSWKNFYFRSFFQVFMLQGALLFIIAWPALFINLSRPAGFNNLSLIGIMVFIIGFYFESVADWQLKKFLENPEKRGKLMQSGLWKYSRHPNYFGEVVLWWGIFLISLPLGAKPYLIIGPLTISILILFVSGIPLLEKRFAGNPEFEDYKKRTSIFWPWPPRPANK